MKVFATPSEFFRWSAERRRHREHYKSNAKTLKAKRRARYRAKMLGKAEA